MSAEKNERNKSVVQLYRLYKEDKSTGFSSYWLKKRFRLDSGRIIVIIHTYWDKYPYPTPEEKVALLTKYKQI